MDNPLILNRQDACSTLIGRSEIARYLYIPLAVAAMPATKVRIEAFTCEIILL